MNQPRIGIFGGTFDPVHWGHIEVAQRVRQLLSLDRVEFFPAYQSPHKRVRAQADAWHRFAMLTLATQERENLFVSTLELRARDVVYTIDTIGQLKRIWGQDAALTFILGADSFQEIMTWREAEELLQSCHLAVMTRPGYSMAPEVVPAPIRERIIDAREHASLARPTKEYHIYLCGGVTNPISSTLIRRALRERRSVPELPPTVRRHIEKYQLYRDTNEAEPDQQSFSGGH